MTLSNVIYLNSIRSVVEEEKGSVDVSDEICSKSETKTQSHMNVHGPPLVNLLNKSWPIAKRLHAPWPKSSKLGNKSERISRVYVTDFRILEVKAQVPNLQKVAFS